jgi:hypothetical protein
MKNQLEALSWLKSNENRSPFASNFFGDKKSILKFVTDLYAAGAKSVEIGNIYDEDWRIKQEGGAYADELLITFPKALVKKINILGLIMKNHPDEFYDVNKNSDGVIWSKITTVGLWWD